MFNHISVAVISSGRAVCVRQKCGKVKHWTCDLREVDRLFLFTRNVYVYTISVFKYTKRILLEDG